MLDTRPLLLETDFPPLRRAGLHTLQVNLGYLCNQSCTHCHVNAGPTRTELMSREIAELVLEFLRRRNLATLDLTGGAPELNPHFRYIVEQASAMGVEVIDRCNLTILNEPGQEDLAAFLAAQGAAVTASLPCYQEENVTKQRGKGIFDSSIRALRKLNALGYGREPGLVLNLVYNPAGLHLPPEQRALERDYKRELGSRYGIVFNELFALANMPISRFGGMLLAKGQYESYMALLKDNFSAPNHDTVMCRGLVSVDYRGYLYDCDFNQMLDLPMPTASGPVRDRYGRGAILASSRPHLRDLLETELEGLPIAIGEHCYGCTAGQGSSCGGALHG